MNTILEKLGVKSAWDKGRVARILVTLCLLFVCFGGILLLVRLFTAIHPAYPKAHWSDLLLEFFVFAFGMITLALIRANRMRAASWVILGALLLVVTMQSIFIANPSNDLIGALGLQLFAFLSILLLGRKDRWIAIILVVAVFIGLNILSSMGYLLPVINQDPLIITLFSIFVWLSVSIIIAGILLSASSAMRREPQLLEQHIQESEGDHKSYIYDDDVVFVSTHDALTGLYNRFFFETELERLSKSRQFPISIISAEVRGLKDINEQYDVNTGDQVLVAVAAIFSKVFRQEDIIARYGGDEFAIILPGANAAIASKVIGRVYKQIEQHNSGNNEIAIDLAIGISTAQAGESLKTHLKHAIKTMKENS